MKNLNYVFTALFCVGITVTGCKKEGELQKESLPKQKTERKNKKESNQDKNLSQNNNHLLISAIQNHNNEFTDLGTLQEFLVAHAPLSTPVLSQLIHSKRIPHELVELMTLISGPVNNQIIQQIKNKRPDLKLESIRLNQTYPSSKQVKVIFTNPISLIVGNSLKHDKLNADCNDCSSIITGSSDTRLIQLKEHEDKFRSIRTVCDSKKVECGKAIAVINEGGRESSPTYKLICDTKVDEVCINGKASK